MGLTNQGIVKAFIRGETYSDRRPLSVSSGGTVPTDRVLCSYGVPISRRREYEGGGSPDFEVVDYRGKWSLSVTTTRHVGLVLSTLSYHLNGLDSVKLIIPDDDQLACGKLWRKQR